MLRLLLKLGRQQGKWLASLAGLAGLLGGCVEQYLPEAIGTPPDYVVVEGFINLNGVTTVHLSRTRSLQAGAASPAEAKASVAILDEAGTRYPLAEQAAGTYTSASLTLSPSHQYQLRLRTAAGRDYASDLVAGKVSPAIDEVTWAVEPTGIQIYVGTHDATNATRYYRWEYQETWEFYSAFQSSYDYQNGQLVPRQDNINHCWHQEVSHAILLNNSSQFSQDVVAKFPLALLATNSERLGVKYSILVQQHAQTAEEFAYWEKLRKNTENLGTLFDPLPSQLSGNVHSLNDASELVLGYVGAGAVAEKRLFIDRSQLPRDLANARFVTGYEGCTQLDTVAVGNAAYYFGTGARVPVFAADGFLPPRRYTAGTPECVDCRLRGTNVKPSYWP